ncbi:MAG: M20/M25/M40 family metallo-hydrolase [Gammaproteobacteria bacterium]|nr:M20/M25/M40 family metallo-hydrolase [Gammaproteobacteria bacterium]
MRHDKLLKAWILPAFSGCLIAAGAPAADLVFPPSTIEPQARTFRLDPKRLAPDDAAKTVDPERIAATMMKILPMSSRSCREGEIAGGAKALLEEAGAPMGIEVKRDELPKKAAALAPERKAEIYCDNGKTAPESGNVIAFLKGDPALPSWNLSFHLDTNQTRFDGIRRDGDLLRPAAGTPLGADDKAGLAIIAEVLRVIGERKLAHGDIRVVGLVAEEDTAAGAQLIDGSAFRGDFVVTADGTDPREIGRAAPTTYSGYLTVRTQTSHPADVHDKKTVSACAVGARILQRAGFAPAAHPPKHPDVVLHSYFTSCGIDEGDLTPKGHPAAKFQYNTISPYWTAAWQLRSLEGAEKAKSMVAGIRSTMERVCANAAKDRTPVRCEMTGDAKPDLLGYVVGEDAPAVQMLGIGFVEAGSGPVKVTARQFGGFNGNYIKERFGEGMIIIGTGADQIHTNQETVSIQGMATVARGLLAGMLESYRFRLVE